MQNHDIGLEDIPETDNMLFGDDQDPPMLDEDLPEIEDIDDVEVGLGSQ